MKNVKTIISSVIIVFAIIVLGNSIYNLNNLSNFSPQDDPEFQRIQSELNDSMISMIDLCTTTNHLGTLMSCKTISIPNLIDICNSEENVNFPICSDVKSNEFFSNLDERIEILSKDHLNKLATLNSEIDLTQYKLIENCYVKQTNLDFCKNSLLEMKNECVQNVESRNLSSCNDPRIEEIINRIPLQSDNYIDIANNQVMDLLASCTQVKTEACVNAAKQIMMACGIEATVQACSDPRLDEIANYNVQPILDSEIINPESTFEQITTDNNLQTMYVIEGNLNPTNRSTELYVVRVSPSNDNRDIVLSVYDSNRIILSQNGFINSGDTFANFFIKFFPPLFQDNATYTIEVKVDGLVEKQLITIRTD